MEKVLTKILLGVGPGWGRALGHVYAHRETTEKFQHNEGLVLNFSIN